MCWANFADFEAEKVSRAFLHPFPSLRSLKKAYPTVDNSEQTPKFLQKKLRKQKQNLLLLFLQLHPPSKKREQPQLFRKKKKGKRFTHTFLGVEVTKNYWFSAPGTPETFARLPRPILPLCWLLPIHRQPAMHRQHFGGRWKTGTPR